MLFSPGNHPNITNVIFIMQNLIHFLNT